MKRCTIENVAVYIINKHNQFGKNLNVTKLQNLLYLTNKALGELGFTDQYERWQFGPSYPKIYYAYRIYGTNIPTQCCLPSIYGISEKDYDEKEIPTEAKKIIDESLEKYFNYTTADLVRITRGIL